MRKKILSLVMTLCAAPAFCELPDLDGLLDKNKIAPRGVFVEAQVPDTLDLAEHARLAAHALLGNLEPEKSFGVYQVFKFGDPAEIGGLTWNLPAKNARALPWMRTMSGSDEGLQMELDLMRALLEQVSEKDGLAYVPIDNDGAPKDTAYPYANGLIALAVLNWFERDGQQSWLNYANVISQGLANIAIRVEDRAYYPPESSYNPDGSWAWTLRGEAKIPYTPPDEPYLEQQGLEGCVKYEQSAALRALVSQYARTGDEDTRDLIERFRRFMLKPGMWEDLTEGYRGNEHGVFSGHFHGNVTSLHALLELAIATDDLWLKQFVREAYDHARSTGAIRLGWVPGWLRPESQERPATLFLASETCGVADMLLLAVKLTDAGLGDYWDDADAFARNHLIAQQITDLERMRALTGDDAQSQALVERMRGGFNQAMEGWINSTGPHAWGCCTANGSIGLYYAWHGITRFENEIATVNLLLNRASKWLDIDSYLPYEGKVVLHNKTARKIMVRIPFWVNRSSLSLTRPSGATDVTMMGNYLLIDDAKPGEQYVVTFDIPRSRESYTIGDREYHIDIAGSTALDVTPRADGEFYHYYMRDEMRADKAPMKTAKRFIPDEVLPLQ